MPIYEYGCGNCGEKVELDRHVVDRDRKAFCPRCNKKMTRLYHPHYDVWHCTGAFKIDRNYEGMIRGYQKDHGMTPDKDR